MRAVSAGNHMTRRRNAPAQPFNCDTESDGTAEGGRNHVGSCLEVISRQSTKITCISTKLEWRIEQFEKLMHLYKNGSHLVSKQFSCSQVPNVVWELHVYPNGKREEDINNASFFLRQVGLLPTDGPIMTEFQIFTVDQNNARISVCRDTKDFNHQQGRGKFQVARDKMINALQLDGSLLVICEVEFLPPGAKNSIEHTETVETDDIANKPEVVVSKMLKDVWEKGTFSDCVLKVGAKQMPAHKCLLAFHSEVFRSMFEQKCTLEAQCGVVNITDSKVESVSAMLEYVYTGSVSPGMLADAEDILAVADKYAIIPLKELCENYLADSLSDKTVAYMAAFSDTYSAEILQKACVKYIAAHQKDVLQTAEWKEFKSAHSHLASDLLESVLSVNNSRDATSSVTVDDRGGSVTSGVRFASANSSAALSSSSSSSIGMRGAHYASRFLRSRSPFRARVAPVDASSGASSSSGTAANVAPNGNQNASELRTPIRKRLRRAAVDGGSH